MATFPTGVVSKPSNIVDGLQILAAHVSSLWDEVVAIEGELTGVGTGTFFLDLRPAASGSVVFQSRQIADSQPRFQFTAAGEQRWGTGAAAVDVTLIRTATRTLTLTGSMIHIPGNAADAPVIIRGAAAQTGLLLDLQDSTSASKISASVAGTLTAVTVTASTAMTAPTKAPGTNTTDVATTAFVGAATVAATAGALPPGMILPYAASGTPAGFLPCDGAQVSRTTYSALYAVVVNTWGAGNGSTTFNVPDFRGRTLIGSGTGAGLTLRTLADIGGAQTHALAIAELAVHDHSGVTGAATPTGTVSSVGTTGTTDAQSATGTIANSAAHWHETNFVDGTAEAVLAGGFIEMARNGSGVSATRFSYEGTAGTGVVTSDYLGNAIPIQGHTDSAGIHSHSFTPTGHAHNVTITAHSHTFTGTSQTHTISSQGSGTAHNNMQPFATVSYIIKT